MLEDKEDCESLKGNEEVLKGNDDKLKGNKQVLRGGEGMLNWDQMRYKLAGRL